jgi:hypothetical protein
MNAAKVDMDSCPRLVKRFKLTNCPTTILYVHSVCLSVCLSVCMSVCLSVCTHENYIVGMFSLNPS